VTPPRHACTTHHDRNGDHPVDDPWVVAVAVVIALATACDVFRGRAFLPLDNVELHLLALLERAKAVTLNGGMMHEAVGPSVRWCDKAKPLRVIEPLNRSCCTHKKLILV